MEAHIRRVLFVLLLLVCLVKFGVNAGRDGSHPGTSKSEGAPKRPSRSSEPKAGRCSYTFIVPQQKLKGALCVSTETARANGSETADLRAQLGNQQEQLERLRMRLEQDGALASEVSTLRRESSTMNARITQLYAQLLHEIINKQEQAEEQRRLEELLLNTTLQVDSAFPMSAEQALSRFLYSLPIIIGAVQCTVSFLACTLHYSLLMNVLRWNFGTFLELMRKIHRMV